MAFRESALAHQLLDGMTGIEIGGAAHNPFGLDAWNVDLAPHLNAVFKRYEQEAWGDSLPVDLVAPGDDLPIECASIDFVLSSHVLEHFQDPIKTLREWWRVIRPGGYVFAIVPHKERTFDRDRPRTTLAELIHRYETGEAKADPNLEHCSVWITGDLVELAAHLGYPVCAVQDVDDKVGNGFTIVLKKPETAPRPVPLSRPNRRSEQQRRWSRRLRVAALPWKRRWRRLASLGRDPIDPPVAAPPPPPAGPPLCPFFAGQVNCGNGTHFLEFANGILYGYFAYLGDSWIYHNNLGYQLVVPGNDPVHSIYLWDMESGHWFYTSPSSFPYLYDFTWNVWLYYFADANRPSHYTTAPRIFANMTTGELFYL